MSQDPNDLLDTVTIGPGCFASRDGKVINWGGVNYVPQSQIDVIVLSNEGKIDLKAEADKLIRRVRQEERDKLVDVDQLLGFDVNDFTSTTTFGVFNDEQVWEPKFASNGGTIPDSMRELLLETPLYEDNDGDRILRHARLTNEDRQRNGTLARDGMVLIKRQVTLRSSWTLDVDVATGGQVAPSEVLLNLGEVRPV